MKKHYKKGQKWISSAEPELGMGSVTEVEHRLVTLHFDIVEETRTYAKDQAPLTRVKFNAGDRIRTLDDIEILISHVTEKDGILVYQGDYQGTATAVIETDLDPNVTFSKPEERLFTHQIDDNRWFNLRYETLQHRARLAACPVKGLLGPRVSLIPHQFFIADEVASRYAPRVLLADEVGLGKTIEAGLIIHQQLVTGRANRILIIVPPSLTFQWFVEMIRRFNLQFTLLDEERCLQIEADNRREFDDDEPGLDNPFDAQQLVLCSLDLFLDNPTRLQQATQTDWDLIVVDEAHHLKWLAGEPGEDYLVVEQLSSIAEGLLLLTATPEQLGRLGHFSRLRLLDPSRYHDFHEFLAEETQYEEVALILNDFETATENDTIKIREKLGEHAPVDDKDLIRALLDRHGTGRVLFRNVRESVAGFQRRQLLSYQLSCENFPADNAITWQSGDPRIQWLIDLVTESEQKYLVICAKAETAIALEKQFRDRTTIRSVAFHENLDLIARDRAANYFADKERGAQLLICSEIGSEGRNFQFAHHLVMFDLPTNPDLLEQRIGRLDRIGQTHDITIHVPYAQGSEQELLLRIFDEGLSIFTRPNVAAQLVFENLPETGTQDDLVGHAKRDSERRLDELKNGRDKLLELNSHRPDISKQLLEAVTQHDSGDDLEAYMEHSFELYGLESEPLSDQIYLVKPTESMVRHSSVSAETMDRYRYPELPDEGLTYTFDRDTALAREDVHFLTWENPLVEQAMDLVASDVIGNNSVVVAKIEDSPTGTLLVETLHLIECVAPARLNATHYLPPTIVRSLITPDLNDISAEVPFSHWENRLDIPFETIAKIIGQQEDGIKKLLETARNVAHEKFSPIKAEAISQMNDHLLSEISRLKALASVNPNVRPEEVEFLEHSHHSLTEALDNSQIRLEAVRIIIAS